MQPAPEGAPRELVRGQIVRRMTRSRHALVQVQQLDTPEANSKLARAADTVTGEGHARHRPRPQRFNRLAADRLQAPDGSPQEVPPCSVDAAVPVDAQDASTVTWKAAQNAVNHTAHSPSSSCEELRRLGEGQLTQPVH